MLNNQSLLKKVVAARDCSLEIVGSIPAGDVTRGSRRNIAAGSEGFAEEEKDGSLVVHFLVEGIVLCARSAKENVVFC